MTDRITEVEFRKKAETAVQELESSYSNLAEVRDLDVEIEGGVLTVTFEEGEPGKFIISGNSAARQIWVSARVSSFKFDWSKESEAFVLAGTGETIAEVLTRLTRAQLGDQSVIL
jgi:CyaY protein